MKLGCSTNTIAARQTSWLPLDRQLRGFLENGALDCALQFSCAKFHRELLNHKSLQTIFHLHSNTVFAGWESPRWYSHLHVANFLFSWRLKGPFKLGRRRFAKECYKTAGRPAGQAWSTLHGEGEQLWWQAHSPWLTTCWPWEQGKVRVLTPVCSPTTMALKTGKAKNWQF